jgi:hypothetical protein
MDLICIDQDNDDEKGFQVALMGQIYRNAERTLVWLGSDDGTVGEASRILKQLVAEMARETNNFDRARMRSKRVGLYGSGTTRPRAWPYSVVQPLVALFQRPWFTRLWVIQEAVLPQLTICVCGDHQVDWVGIGRAAIWLLYKDGRHGEINDIPEALRTNLELASTLWTKVDFRLGTPLGVHAGTTRASFCDVLQNCVGFDVTNPRDRVYGIMGLLKWSEKGVAVPKGLQPHYSKSVLEVYRDAIKVNIADVRNLNILNAEFKRQAFVFTDLARAEILAWVLRWD